MMLLREVVSIVLLITPAYTETLRPPDTYGFHADGATRQDRILLPLMKDAMRLVTGCVGSAAPLRYEIPTKPLMIGIRG